MSEIFMQRITADLDKEKQALDVALETALDIFGTVSVRYINGLLTSHTVFINPNNNFINP